MALTNQGCNAPAPPSRPDAVTTRHWPPVRNASGLICLGVSEGSLRWFCRPPRSTPRPRHAPYTWLSHPCRGAGGTCASAVWSACSTCASGHWPRASVVPCAIVSVFNARSSGCVDAQRSEYGAASRSSRASPPPQRRMQSSPVPGMILPCSAQGMGHGRGRGPLPHASVTSGRPSRCWRPGQGIGTHCHVLLGRPWPSG